MHEVCVYFAYCRVTKNSTNDSTNSLLENLWTETKTSEEQVKFLYSCIDPESCSSIHPDSFGKPLDGITKKFWNFFVSQYRKISNWAAFGSFWCF